MDTASEQTTKSMHLPPAYLPVALVLTVLSGLLTLGIPGIEVEGSLGVAIGILAVVFFPGFALVVALFPSVDHRLWAADPLSFRSEEANAADERPVTVLERLVLSVGLSLCIVPVLGLVLNFTPWLIQPGTLTSVLGATILVLALVATVRWLRIPPERRFRVPVFGSLREGWERTLSAPTRVDLALNLLVVVGFVVASSGIAYAVLGPNDGEQFTELYLVTEDPVTGALVAANYPDEIPRDGSADLVLGITNREDRTLDYTVVVVLQVVGEVDGVESVQRERELDRFEVTLEAGETLEQPHTVRPAFSGADLRLTYLLYQGNPPAEPSAETAYRQVHLWVDIPATPAELVTDGGVR